MGNETSWVWFWNHLQAGERKLSRRCSKSDGNTTTTGPFYKTPHLAQRAPPFFTTPTGLALTRTLLTKPTNHEVFQLCDGLIYHKQRLYIPEEPSICQQLLKEYHASPLGRHSGTLPIMKRISPIFLWPKLKIDVTTFIHNCASCQQIKSPIHKPYGLLQPLPVPSMAWQDISMDFITHLPLSTGKTAIWVIVDRFSKTAHFITLPTNFGAVTLARLFLSHIYKLHGIPKSIVSDRDSIFLSSFWKELFKQLGTHLRYSTMYRPQTDGQTEVVNRCLQNYLRSFVSDEPRCWTKFLHFRNFGTIQLTTTPSGCHPSKPYMVIPYQTSIIIEQVPQQQPLSTPP